MFKQEKALNILVVISIIITLTLYYFLLIGVTTVTYAASSVKGNIEFQSYFKDEDGNSLETISQVTTEEIYLYFYVDVLKEGYFNGEITISDGNFDIDSEIIDEKISSIENNTIIINQVNNGEPQEFKVKINIKTSKEFDLNLLEKETNVTLSGIYANSKKEKSVEETAIVQLIYESPYYSEEDALTLSVLTNKIEEIDGEEKRLVQIQLTSSLDGNAYPVKQTSITLTVPNGAEDVSVYTRGTSLTNGKSSSDDQDSNSYTYTEEDNTLRIKLKNEIEETESGEEIVTWKDSGNDKLIITYVLPRDTKMPQTIKAVEKITLYDGYITEHNTTKIKSTASIKVKNEVNGVVTGQIVTENTSIYKGKIYSGEEKEISTITKIGINYAGIENEIKLSGINANYEQTENSVVVDELSENLVTNETSIQRSYLEKVLGDNGSLTVKVGDTEIAKINKNVLERLDKLEENTTISQSEYATIKLNDGNIEIEYNIDQQYDIDILIENAEKEGEIYITNNYTIKNTYSREELKNINNLNLSEKIGTANSEREIETNIKLEETTTKANFKIVKGTLNENDETDNVEFLVLLRNDSEKYDLYSNPYIEIELPEEIEDVEINSVNLVYEDGLSIVGQGVYEKNGKKVIRIELQGRQTTHQIETETKGTYIVVNTKISLGEIEESKETDVNLAVVNRQEGEESKEELQGTIKYIKHVGQTTVKSSTETISSSIMDNIEKNGNLTVIKTASVDEGADVKEREIIKYTISVRNNTNSTLENITITDEIPEKTTYVNYYTGGGYENGYYEDESVTSYQKTGISIEAGETQDFEYCVIVNKDDNNIGTELVSNEATITIGESGEEFKTNAYTNTIQEGKVEITIAYVSNIMEYVSTGSTYGYIIKVKNLTDEKLTDVVIEDELISELECSSACILGKNEKGEYNIYADGTTKENVTYEESTNTVEFNLETLNAQEEKAMYMSVEVKEDSTSKYLENTVYTDIEGERYEAFTETVRHGVEDYEISIESSVEGTYITEGDTFVYTVTVKNLGDITTAHEIQCELPEGITGNMISYSIEADDTESGLDMANHTDIVDLSNVYTSALNGESTSNETEETTEEKEATIYESIYVDLVAAITSNATLTAKIYVTADMLEDDVEQLEIRNSVRYGAETSNELYNIIVRSDRSATDNDDTDDEENDGNVDTSNYVDQSDFYTVDTTNSNTTTNNNSNNDNNSYTSAINNGTTSSQDETGQSTMQGSSSGSTSSNSSSLSNSNEISGVVWVDINLNGAKDSNEAKLEDVTVKLLNSATNSYVGTTVTDSSGYYEFTDLSNGDYIVVFEYDSTQYKLTEYQKSGVSSNANSDVITSIESDGIGYTDTITVYNEDIANIDMGLIYNGTFDFSLNKTITNISVTNDSGSKSTDYDNTSLAKVEISSKLLSSSTVVITYNITVTNEGEIAGYVDKIVDYIPDGLTFNSTMNSDWYQSEDLLITNSLSGQSISPGESKTVELVLVKTMSTSNTGTVSNSAEIMETSNTASAEDADSTPNNKVISEDDYSTANVIISVSTGMTKYISITFIIIIILATVILILMPKIRRIRLIYWNERRR